MLLVSVVLTMATVGTTRNSWTVYPKASALGVRHTSLTERGLTHRCQNYRHKISSTSHINPCYLESMS